MTATKALQVLQHALERKKSLGKPTQDWNVSWGTRFHTGPHSGTEKAKWEAGDEDVNTREELSQLNSLRIEILSKLPEMASIVDLLAKECLNEALPGAMPNWDTMDDAARNEALRDILIEARRRYNSVRLPDPKARFLQITTAKLKDVVKNTGFKLKVRKPPSLTSS